MAYARLDSIDQANNIERCVKQAVLEEIGVTPKTCAALHPIYLKWRVLVQVHSQVYDFYVDEDLTDWQEFHDLLMQIKLSLDYS